MQIPRFRSIAVAAALTLAAGAATAQTPVGSSFTYQGQLNISGAVANGAYDLQFKLYDAASGGNQIGSMLTASAVTISKGLFTQPLDFGAGALNGSARWLEIAVRPAGQGAYTTLLPRQPLSAAPYAAALALPCSEAQSSSSPLLALSNSSATGYAISGTTSGGVSIYGQTSTGIGVWGYNLGASGNAGFFRNENVNNTAPCVLVQGSGGDGVYATSNSGIPGQFEITNAANTAAALSGTTAGTGSAGIFSSTNTSSVATTLLAAASGGGTAVTAVTFGTGRAGQFTISNSGSAASAIEATTNGTGLAGKFNGPVDVAGKLTTTYGGGGQHRAAPIAYGSFGLLGAGTSTISGSGNVTVAYLGSDTYRVTVSGQSNPSSWIVEARVAYSNPASPDVEYENLRVGIPNASGQILIYCPCTSGCGVFTSQSADVHYVVYQP